MNTQELQNELKELETKITESIRTFIDKTGFAPDFEIQIDSLYSEGKVNPDMTMVNVRAKIEIESK